MAEYGMNTYEVPTVAVAEATPVQATITQQDLDAAYASGMKYGKQVGRTVFRLGACIVAGLAGAGVALGMNAIKRNAEKATEAKMLQAGYIAPVSYDTVKLSDGRVAYIPRNQQASTQNPANDQNQTKQG